MSSKSIGVLLSISLLSLSLLLAGRADADYTNPVYSGDFPDPQVFILSTKKQYYAYSTGGLLTGHNIEVSTSTNLTTWSTPVEALYDSGLGSWADTAAPVWAPSVLERWYGAPYYVMYYSAKSLSSHRYCIGRAVSTTSPVGPYSDGSSAPIACGSSEDVIDPSPYLLPGATGNNPQAYLLWSGRGKIYTQALDAAGTLGSVAPTTILNADSINYPWERTGTIGTTEGPSIAYDSITQKYKLFYAAGQWRTGGYATGYATCDLYLGLAVNCARPKSGPWLASSGQVEGPGGLEPFKDPSGNLWVAYHAWASSKVGYGSGGVRSLRIDKLCFNKGIPVTNAPTTTATSIARSSTCTVDVPNDPSFSWGNAPSGTLRVGNWSLFSRNQVSGTSFGGLTWQRVFKQDQYRSQYSVQLRAQWVASGTGSAYPKYGIYAVYKDKSNYAVVFLDKNCQCLATSGVVGAQPQAWINYALGPLDFSQRQTLRVEKDNTTLRYYVNGVLRGSRVFAISTGQVGLVTEDTKADFSQITVAQPGYSDGQIWWPYAS